MDCDYSYGQCETGITIGIVIGVIAAHLVPPAILWMCEVISSYGRCMSLCWYVFFFPWLLVLLLFECGVIQPARTYVHLLAIVMCALTYVVVLIESCCSHEEQYLSESYSEDETHAYIASIRLKKPEVITHVECYHRERRTRTKRDSKGHTRTETYYVTVVTWKGRREYEIPYWRDTSEETPTFNSMTSTRLTLPDIIHFVDADSKQHYIGLRDAYVDENRHRDISIAFHTTYEIPGHIKRRMVCGRNYVKPWWMSLGYYYLAVLIHGTWPYRLLLRANSEGAECHIVKEISVTPFLQPTAPETHPGAYRNSPNASAPPYILPPVMERSISSDLMLSSLPPPPSYDEACGKSNDDGG